MTSRSRKSTSPRALSALILSLALVGSACGGGSSDPTTDSTAVPIGDDPVTVPATDETATTAAESTTTTVALKGSSPDDPAPVGDPEFDLTGFGSGPDSVDASMLGLVALPLDPDGSNTGRCVAVLAVMSVREAEALVANSSAYPRLELFDGDTTLSTDYSDCDDSTLIAAGYQVSVGINATVGTQVGVYNVYNIEEGVTPDAMMLGRTGDEASRYYELTELATIPPLDGLQAGPAPAGLLATSADPVRLSGAVLDDTSVFDVNAIGLLPVEKSEYGDGIGNCITVLTTLKGIESPGAIINAFAVPGVYLLSAGRAFEQEIGECDDSTLEAVGYYSDLGAGVAVGNTFAAQTSFLLPEGATPQAIVIGNPSTVDGYFVFEPTALGVAPPAPEREKINPVVNLVPVSTSAFTYEGLSETTWGGTVDGLIALTHNAQSATCYAVVGQISRDGDGTSPPDFGIIADGGIYGGGAITLASCDTEVLIAAGYTELRDLREMAPGAPAKFFETVFLPTDVGALASIAVGNAASADKVTFYEPTVLAVIP